MRLLNHSLTAIAALATLATATGTDEVLSNQRSDQLHLAKRAIKFGGNDLARFELDHHWTPETHALVKILGRRSSTSTKEAKEKAEKRKEAAKKVEAKKKAQAKAKSLSKSKSESKAKSKSKSKSLSKSKSISKSKSASKSKSKSKSVSLSKSKSKAKSLSKAKATAKKHTTTSAKRTTTTQAAHAAAGTASVAKLAAVSTSSSDLTASVNVKPAALAAHNALRAKHSAADVSWDDNLESLALAWAKKCVFEDGGGESVGAGSNIAAISGTGGDTAAQIAMWSNEAKLYDPAVGWNEASGHFSQMVWKATTKIGCAMTYCPSFSNMSWGGNFLVCEYTTAGNVIGAFDQNVIV